MTGHLHAQQKSDIAAPCAGRTLRCAPLQEDDGSQPLSTEQARLLKKLARQPDALAGLLQASTRETAAGAKV